MKRQNENDLFAKHKFRLEDLLREHQIDDEPPACWEKLSAILAERLGLLADVWDDRTGAWVKTGTKKPGRKAIWSTDRKAKLLLDFGSVLATDRCKPSKAAKKLAKTEEWKLYSANTLEARYSDFLKEREISEVADEIVNRLNKSAIARAYSYVKEKRSRFSARIYRQNPRTNAWELIAETPRVLQKSSRS